MFLPNVDEFMGRSGVEFEKPVELIIVYVNVTPGCVGDTPGVSIVSMVDNYVLVGVDFVNTVWHENYQDEIINHIKTLRLDPMMAKSKIVLHVEPGTGMEASHITDVVKHHCPDVISMNDDKKTSVIRTRDGQKVACMFFTLHGIWIWKELKRHPVMMQILDYQFRNYTKQLEPCNSIMYAAVVLSNYEVL